MKWEGNIYINYNTNLTLLYVLDDWLLSQVLKNQVMHVTLQTMRLFFIDLYIFIVYMTLADNILKVWRT